MEAKSKKGTKFDNFQTCSQIVKLVNQSTKVLLVSMERTPQY